jgi:hypothetical protein
VALASRRGARCRDSLTRLTVHRATAGRGIRRCGPGSSLIAEATMQIVIFAYETGVNRPIAAEDPAASST